MLRLFMMSNEKNQLPAVLMPNISLENYHVISSLLEHSGVRELKIAWKALHL